MYEEFLEKELLTVDEVAEILYLGKNTVYSLLRSGELQAIRFGRVWRIPKGSIQKLIEIKKQKLQLCLGMDCLK